MFIDQHITKQILVGQRKYRGKEENHGDNGYTTAGSMFECEKNRGKFIVASHDQKTCQRGEHTGVSDSNYIMTLVEDQQTSTTKRDAHLIHGQDVHSVVVAHKFGGTATTTVDSQQDTRTSGCSWLNRVACSP